MVGNETVHKAVARGQDAKAAVARLKSEIEQLQQQHGKPVTTGLHRDDWSSHPEIATEFGDFVFANLQPWWVQLRNDPETAAKWVVDVIQVIRDTPGMPKDRVILIQEAAFPSGCVPPEAAPGATPEAQAVFYQRLIESGQQFVYSFRLRCVLRCDGLAARWLRWPVGRRPQPQAGGGRHRPRTVLTRARGGVRPLGRSRLVATDSWQA